MPEALRDPLIILGVEVGTHTGWNDFDILSFGFSDFIPNSATTLPACSCLNADFDKGLLEATDDEGNVLASFDMLDLRRTKET